MRILVISQYFWPENFRINDLVQDLIDRGHEVTVLTGLPNYPSGKVFSDFRKKPEMFSKFSGAKIVRVPLITRGNGGFRLVLNYLTFALSASLVGFFRLRKSSFDVIFVCQLSPVTVGIPAVVFRSLKRIPVVFWVLDLWPETLSALGYRSKIILKLVGGLVSFIYNRCDLILGQSKGFIKNINKYCSQPQKFRYFPSWSETLFSEKSTVLAPEVQEKSKVFNIVFTGNIGQSQDFPTILDAVELLKPHKDIRWLVVGDGRDADWVKKEIFKRGLSGSVEMLGRYPLDRMPSFISHADVLLVTLKKEPAFSLTIPGKVQSYLASGIPIVGMLDGEGARVISESQAGFVCPAGDSHGLANLILEMKSLTKVERERLGKNGKSYTEREFNRSKLINQLENWFDEVVAQE